MDGTTNTESARAADVAAASDLAPARRPRRRREQRFNMAPVRRASFEALAVLVLTPLVLTILLRVLATPAYFQQFSQLVLSDEVIAVRQQACGVDRPFAEHAADMVGRQFTLDLGQGLRSDRPLDNEVWPRTLEMVAFLIVPAFASILVGFALATLAWVLPLRRFAVRAVTSANLVPYPLILVVMLLIAEFLGLPTNGAMSADGLREWGYMDKPTNSYFFDFMLAGRFDLVAEWLRFALAGMAGLAVALGLAVAALILKAWQDLESHPTLEAMRGVGFGERARFWVRCRLGLPVVMGLMGFLVLQLPAGAILTEALTDRQTSLGGYIVTALLHNGDLNALVAAVIVIAWIVALLHVGWQTLAMLADPMRAARTGAGSGRGGV